MGKISLIQEQSKKLYKMSPFKKPSFSKEHIKIDDQNPSDKNTANKESTSSHPSLMSLVDESAKLQEKIN